MKLKLRIWRQAGANAAGRMAEYDIDGVSEDMSFLEMLDLLNENLTAQNQEPVAFDHDCREGICGMCGVVINGVAHGGSATTTCQLHMRSFADGATIDIEPWRAGAFPVINDLVVDRTAQSPPRGSFTRKLLLCCPPPILYGFMPPASVDRSSTS